MRKMRLDLLALFLKRATSFDTTFDERFEHGSLPQSDCIQLAPHYAAGRPSFLETEEANRTIAATHQMRRTSVSGLGGAG